MEYSSCYDVSSYPHLRRPAADVCVYIGNGGRGGGGGSSTKDTYTSTLGGPVPCSSSGVNKRWLLVPVNKAQSAFLGLDLYIAGNIFGHFCNGPGRTQCKYKKIT